MSRVVPRYAWDQRLSRNDAALIQRVMRHFRLDAGMYTVITAEGGMPTHLPAGEPAPLLGVLTCCVELQDVATRHDIALMARYTDDPRSAAAGAGQERPPGGLRQTGAPGPVTDRSAGSLSRL